MPQVWQHDDRQNGPAAPSIVMQPKPGVVVGKGASTDINRRYGNYFHILLLISRNPSPSTHLDYQYQKREGILALLGLHKHLLCNDHPKFILVPGMKQPRQAILAWQRIDSF
ncbi:hypothetical protein H5410_003370 [Solanum commersonii]|uniref:Uncharacterized protein n=1 Tax=Solanum commersonii TaxID=4109 RepID=A0A9J6B4H5_SOLCO|nr:hypothetical protein H5410_003370 [Solanum commersonii]